MATPLYAEEYADFRFRGDTLTVDGTTTLTGAVGCTAALTVGTTLGVTGAATITGGVTLIGTATNAAGKLIPLTIGSGSLTTGTAGAVWTSGVPALTAAQLYVTIKVGSTNYRLPLWADA